MDFRGWSLKILLCTLFTVGGLGLMRSSEACPIGDSSLTGTPRDPDTIPGQFYWSEALEASCPGTITRVRYCYHNSPDLPLNSALARFSFYRRNTFQFSRIVGSGEFTIRNTVPFTGSSELVCDHLELGTTVEIGPRDVIGVCLPPEEDDVALPILSDAADGNTLFTLPCSGQPLDTFFRGSFTSIRNARLHLFADADNDVTTEAMNTNTPTQPLSTADTAVTTRGSPSTMTTKAMPIATTEEASDSVGPGDTMDGSSGISATSTDNAASDSTTEEPPVGSSDGGGGVGRAVGITSAVFLLVMVAVVAAVVVILLVVRKKRTVYLVKPGSSLARNSLATASTIGFSGYIHVEEGTETYAQVGEPQANNFTELPTVYENPQYFSNRIRKPSRGKNVDGYYCPDAVMYSELTPKEELQRRDSNPYQEPANHERELYAQLRCYGITKISRSELEAQQHLGSGQFGSVEKGVWRRNGKEMEVALKTMKESEGMEEDKIKFLQEAVMMAQFQHPNVLYLCGVARQGETIVLVTELAHRGDLKEYLLSMKIDPVTTSDQLPKLLLSFSQHIARGMEYLSAKGFVHRDLAARNILVTDNNICKVADFGMSRDLFDGNYYFSTGGKVPLKWTAPESLHYSKYSTASDVWSYGCVLYEIWSLGTKPFSRVKNEDVIDFIDAGKRLTPPPGCPRLIYQMMISCWHPDTRSRPEFHEIMSALEGEERQVLLIPPEDLSSHTSAGILGALLEAGAGMYPDLCTQYSRYSTTADGEEEEEEGKDNEYDNVAD